MTRVTVLFGIVALAAPAISLSQDSQKQDSKLTVEEAKQLKNPIPYTRKSIKQGHAVFVRYCTGCHGNDGKATVDVVADASDLTAPKTWKNGYSEGEIFRSIRDGQGASMPAFKSQIASEDDMWHLVNFIRSLWPEDMRPPLQEDK